MIEEIGLNIGREERVREYLHSLEPGRCRLLEEMRCYAGENDIPIVKEETEAFLRTAAAIKSPKSVLEIGTAIAYSTIVLAESSNAGIYTIESYEKRIPVARANIDKSGYSDRITLLEGDAGVIIKTLTQSFDLIFLDAAKAQYITWLPDIKKHMYYGSVLIADNVLQDGTVTESRFTVPRRERTIHERMREFLWQIKHDGDLQTCILPVGDGVSLSVMKKQDKSSEVP